MLVYFDFVCLGGEDYVVTDDDCDRYVGRLLTLEELFWGNIGDCLEEFGEVAGIHWGLGVDSWL